MHFSQRASLWQSDDNHVQVSGHSYFSPDLPGLWTRLGTSEVVHAETDALRRRNGCACTQKQMQSTQKRMHSYAETDARPLRFLSQINDLAASCIGIGVLDLYFLYQGDLKPWTAPLPTVPGRSTTQARQAKSIDEIQADGTELQRGTAEEQNHKRTQKRMHLEQPRPAEDRSALDTRCPWSWMHSCKPTVTKHAETDAFATSGWSRLRNCIRLRQRVRQDQVWLRVQVGTGDTSSLSGATSTQKQMHLSSMAAQLAVPWHQRTTAPPCRAESATSSTAAPASAAMTTKLFLSMRARTLWLAMPHRKSRTTHSSCARPGWISKRLLSRLLSLRCRQPVRDVRRRLMDQGGEDVGLPDVHGAVTMASPTMSMSRKGEHLVAVLPFHAHALAVAYAETDAIAAFAGRARWRGCCACRPCWTRRNRCISPSTRGTQKRMHFSRRRVLPRETGALLPEKSLCSRYLGNPGFRPRRRGEANWCAWSPCWSVLAPWPVSKRRARLISVPVVLQRDAAAQESFHGRGRVHHPGWPVLIWPCMPKPPSAVHRGTSPSCGCWWSDDVANRSPLPSGPWRVGAFEANQLRRQHRR